MLWGGHMNMKQTLYHNKRDFEQRHHFAGYTPGKHQDTHVSHISPFQLKLHFTINQAQKAENFHHTQEDTMEKSQDDDQSRMTLGLVITFSQHQTNIWATVHE